MYYILLYCASLMGSLLKYIHSFIHPEGRMPEGCLDRDILILMAWIVILFHGGEYPGPPYLKQVGIAGTTLFLQ